MSAYLDASVIVPNLIDEPSTPQVERWFRAAAHELMLSDLARGEVVSALYRAVRDGRQGQTLVATRIDMFEGWRVEACTEVTHLPEDVRFAVDLVKRFELGLRMPDALHLAACARLDLTLVTFDRRILRAAEAIGVAAMRPS